MYERDLAKAEANRAKHGVAFTEVERFDWATCIERPDDRVDYGEVRYIALGFIGPALHMLTYAERRGKIRVISLRRATRAERKAYVQAKAGPYLG